MAHGHRAKRFFRSDQLTLDLPIFVKNNTTTYIQLIQNYSKISRYWIKTAIISWKSFMMASWFKFLWCIFTSAIFQGSDWQPRSIYPPATGMLHGDPVWLRRDRRPGLRSGPGRRSFDAAYLYEECLWWAFRTFYGTFIVCRKPMSSTLAVTKIRRFGKSCW